MNRKALLLICAALLLAALPIHAQDFNDCTNFEGEVDYEEIVDACTELLEIDPLNIDGYFNRAYAQTELGNFEDSIVDYSKVLFLSPKYSLAYNNRGFAYYLMGNYEEAIRDYSRALVVDETYTQALLNRAYAYLDSGDLDSAIADSEQLIEMDPFNVNAYSLQGSIFIEQENYDQALDAYNQYIDLAPDDPSGYLGRGFVYWSQDEDALAAADYLVWVQTLAQNVERISPRDALEPLTITMEEGTHYILPIEGEEGDILNARAAARQATVDPVLILLDPDGEPIAMDDDGGGGFAELDALIEDFELPEDGEYTLVIGYAGGGADGDVRLDVRLGSAV